MVNEADNLTLKQLALLRDGRHEGRT